MIPLLKLALRFLDQKRKMEYVYIGNTNSCFLKSGLVQRQMLEVKL